MMSASFMAVGNVFFSWANPLFLGLFLGTMLVGPDHIGTLIALSAVLRGREAFRVGALWGLGHSASTILVGPVAILLRAIFNVSEKDWSYYGDFVVGLSMMLCGLYLLRYEDSYIAKQEDGTFVAIGCECHMSSNDGGITTDMARTTETMSLVHAYTKGKHASRTEQSLSKLSSKLQSYGVARRDTAPNASNTFEESDLDKAESGANDKSYCGHPFGHCGPSWSPSAILGPRGLQGLALGAFQGVCCPMGLVCATMMGRFESTADFVWLVVFVLAFAVSTSVSSGLLTLGWGQLTNAHSGSWINAQVMYRGSCLLTVVLGVAWVVCNEVGILSKLDYTDGTREGRTN